MTHREKAQEYFYKGYNCAQSVFAAYADEYGFTEEMALKLSASFGAGFGRMREVCGCFSGISFIAGLETGCTDGSADGKAANYKVVQELAEIYKQRAGGSIICHELLGLEKKEGSFVPAERNEEYYKKRPCPELIGLACDIIDEYFKK